ncbi:MAG TPA: response regulator [Nitrospirota bacterium]
MFELSMERNRRMTDTKVMAEHRRDDADAPRRLLIIDDEEHLREMLSIVLTSYGMEVTTCANAAEALLQPMLHEFHYILTDHNMPGMNGLDLTRQLRRRLPFAIIIGMSGTDTSVDFLRAGANDFLHKPFAAGDLASMINGPERSGLNS